MIPRWLKRRIHQNRLRDQAYQFLFEPGPEDEVVVFDCETTGHNLATDDIVAIAALKVRGTRILASERFVAVARPDAEMGAAAIKTHRLLKSDVAEGGKFYDILPAFLKFIGGRPLVGYYNEFDIAMVDKYLRPFLGVELPNPQIEVSRIYYERKYAKAPPGSTIDLSFASMLRDLEIPLLEEHDAFNRALMTAEAFVVLQDYQRRDIRIGRQEPLAAKAAAPAYGPGQG